MSENPYQKILEELGVDFDAPHISDSRLLPFITGSVAYGVPHDESDIDLFLLVDRLTFCNLIDSLDDDDPGSGDELSNIFATLRVGKLNLLLTCSERYYECWKKGTQELVDQRPVTREKAVEVLIGHCVAAGFPS